MMKDLSLADPLLETTHYHPKYGGVVLRANSTVDAI